MTITTFNYLEASLWFAIASILFINAISRKKYIAYKKTMLISSACFLLFGVSDIIEAHTGAWWEPVELLVFKALCIIGFVFCFFSYLNIKRDQT